MYMALKMRDLFPDAKLLFVFANTGLEHEATLEFVDLCSKMYHLEIVWLEAVVHPGRKGCSHRQVDFASASRNGQPMEEVIKKYGLPNKSYPHCNRETKLNPIHSFATQVFGGKQFQNYSTAIGIRVDEIDRMRANYEKYNFLYPLISNLPTYKSDILNFWNSQPIRLDLPEHYGNCKACFKKSDRKLATIALERPDYFIEAKRFEELYSEVKVPEGGAARKMYRGHKTTEDIFAISREGTFVPFTDPNWVYDRDLDLDEDCTHDCSLT